MNRTIFRADRPQTAQDRWWCELLRTLPPDRTIVPTPAWDRGRWDVELACLAGSTLGQVRAQALAGRLKTTNLEALTLADMAKSCREIVEIGSGSGGSMLCFALGEPQARVTCVDPFEPYDEQTATGMNRSVREGNAVQFERALQTFGLGPARVRLFRQPSALAGPGVAPSSVDLVFVDGNHSHWAAALDLRLWWPKLRPAGPAGAGGLMVVHDYTTRFPGVIAAVDGWEAEAGVEVRACPGTSLVWAQKGARP